MNQIPIPTVDAITADGTPADVTSSDRRMGRWAGITGVAATAAFVATAVLVSAGAGVEAAADPSDVARFVADISAAEVLIALYAIAGLALCVLYVPMTLAMRTMRSERRAFAGYGSLNVLAGLVLLFPAYVLAAGQIGFVSALDAGVDADAIFAIQEFARTSGELLFAAGSVLSLGVGPLLWGIAGRSGGMSRRVANLAIGVGITGAVWLIPQTDHPAVVVAVIVNALGSLVLFTSLSWSLLRTG